MPIGVVPPGPGRPGAVLAAHLVAAHLVAGRHPSPSPPTTARSPFVTLQPPGPSGGIPGDANDGADFYGLGAAVIGIALVVVLAKLAFRGRGRTVRREDHEER